LQVPLQDPCPTSLQQQPVGCNTGQGRVTNDEKLFSDESTIQERAWYVKEKIPAINELGKIIFSF